MGSDPGNAPVPRRYPFWVNALAPAAKRSYLLADYLEGVMVRRDHKDAATVRTFLIAWRKVTQGNNPMELELRAVRAKGNTAVVFVASPYVGAVRRLPTLVIPWADRLDAIERDCRDIPILPRRPDPERDEDGNIVRRRPPVFDKVDIQLVRPGH